MSPQERVMRIMKYAFVVSILLFLFMAFRIPSNAKHPPQQPIELIIMLLGLVNIILGWNGRSILARLAQANTSSPNRPTPLNQWFAANIFSLAMMESCALFALVLHLLGSSTKLVGILFACALLALLFWTPGAPPTTENIGGAIS